MHHLSILLGARVAQWLQAQIGNHEIESSNPTGGAKDVLYSFE